MRVASDARSGRGTELSARRIARCASNQIHGRVGIGHLDNQLTISFVGQINGIAFCGLATSQNTCRPLNVATVAPTVLESPRDQGNSSGRRKF